jgi:hypothetical protein
VSPRRPLPTLPLHRTAAISCQLLAGLSDRGVTQVAVSVIGWFRGRRERADAEAAARLEWLRSMADPRLGVHVVHVRSVYQRARSGTKAVIVVEGFPGTRDAWFWHSRAIAVSQVLAVSLGIGYGPHTNREGVVYIGQRGTSTGVRAVLPGSVVAAASRHYERVQRSGQGF